MNNSDALEFSLDDLRVESFDTLPNLQGAGFEPRAARDCFPICQTGESVVCCYPTLGNGSGGGDPCSMHSCTHPV